MSTAPPPTLLGGVWLPVADTHGRFEKGHRSYVAACSASLNLTSDARAWRAGGLRSVFRASCPPPLGILRRAFSTVHVCFGSCGRVAAAIEWHACVFVRRILDASQKIRSSI